MPQPILKEVTYGEGLDILQDDGSGAFEAPHWKDDREVQYPYLYKGGNRITVAEVKFLLPDCELEGPFYASGEGSDEHSFEEVEASSEITEEGTVVTATNLYSSISSLDNETKFFDSLEIEWKLRHGSGEPVTAGTSASPVYVCLEEGSLASDKRFYAVVHTACSVDGASTPDQAFENAWSLFELRTVVFKNLLTGAWEPLYYYRKTADGKVITADQNATQLADPNNAENSLLRNTNKTGQCYAWAELLAWCLLANFPANKTRIRRIKSTSSDYEAFLIKEWSTIPVPNGYIRAAKFPSSVVDPQHLKDVGVLEMMPEPPGKVYGFLINDKVELKGQNTAPPSEKAFGEHAVVTVESNGTTWVCDPSYGKKYSDLHELQQQSIQLFGALFTWPDTQQQVLRWGLYLTEPPANELWLRFV